MNKPPLFGLHIPKCAGTTILERARSCLSSTEFYQTTSHYQNLDNGDDEFLQLKRYTQLKLIFGHSVHEEMLRYFEGVVLFVCLRPPHERLKSAITYELAEAKKRNEPAPTVREITQWNENKMCKFIVRRFPSFCGDVGSLSERAWRGISRFNVIFFTVNYEAVCDKLYRYLNVKPTQEIYNVSSGDHIDFDVSDGLIAEDIRLYERALHEFEKRNWSEADFLVTDYVKEFCSGSKQLERLRQFLYAQTYDEYKSWNRLDAVITRNRRLIKELQAELAFYGTKEDGRAQEK